MLVLLELIDVGIDVEHIFKIVNLDSRFVTLLTLKYTHIIFQDVVCIGILL